MADENRIRKRAHAIWVMEERPVGDHEIHWSWGAQELREESKEDAGGIVGAVPSAGIAAAPLNGIAGIADGNGPPRKCDEREPAWC